MPKEFNPLSKDFTFKEQTFVPLEVNPIKFFVPKKADIFTPLRYEKISSIFKPMAEGNTELGISPVKTESMEIHNPQTRKVTEPLPKGPLDEAKLKSEQDEFGE